MCGKILIKNFLQLAKVSFKWNMKAYLEQAIEIIKEKVGDKKVICALSGGVDSSVTAILIHKAIGDQLTCIYVNNGLMRKNEFKYTFKTFKQKYNLNVKLINASKYFHI